MKMKQTEEEFLREQGEALDKFRKAKRLLAELPEPVRETARITVHRNHATVQAWDSYEPKQKLGDAEGVIRDLKDRLVQGDHFRAGCLSTYPAEINDYASRESAEACGMHLVEIRAEGGKGFSNVTVKAWVRWSEGLAELSMPVSGLDRMKAARVPIRGPGDQIIGWRIEFNADVTSQADHFRKWAGGSPDAYMGSYYWGTYDGFIKWSQDARLGNVLGAR